MKIESKRTVSSYTLMTLSKEDQKFEQLVQKIDPQSKLLRTWELKGGVSAQVTALEIERPDGQTKKMIVRQHGDVDLKQNPHVAADEFKLLQMIAICRIGHANALLPRSIRQDFLHAIRSHRIHRGQAGIRTL